MPAVSLATAILALIPAFPVGAGEYLASGQPAISATMREDAHKDGIEFINTMQRSATAVNEYSLSYKMTVYKAHKTVEETGLYYFKKPRLMRSEVLSGPRKGALAVLGEDGKIRGHFGGLLKMFSGTIGPDSPWAKLLNGYPMVESDYLSLTHYLKSMLKSGYTSQVSNEPVSAKHVARKVYVLELHRKAGSGSEIAKRVFVDPANNLPVAWEDFTNGKLSALTTWSQVKFNIALDDSKFRL